MLTFVHLVPYRAALYAIRPNGTVAAKGLDPTTWYHSVAWKLVVRGFVDPLYLVFLECFEGSSKERYGVLKTAVEAFAQHECSPRKLCDVDIFAENIVLAIIQEDGASSQCQTYCESYNLSVA